MKRWDREHGAAGMRQLHRSARASALVDECAAQATLEYAITFAALLAMVIALGALWRAGERGALSALVEQAASHALGATGALDIALF